MPGGGGGGGGGGCPPVTGIRHIGRMLCPGGGGGGAYRIPGASAGCSNGASISANIDNTAEKQMHEHLADSVSRDQEWAGFIYKNNSNGQLVSVGRWYATDPSGNAIGFPGMPPGYVGWTPVAWFHDHPTAYGNSDDPTGVQGPGQVPPGEPYSGNYFSADDEGYSNGNNLVGYVGLENSYGNEWARWSPGGTIGQQQNYTNEEGLQSGC